MQKWEYLFEDVSPLTMSTDPRRAQVLARFRELGQQGWELVTMVPDRGLLWAALKRPAEDRPAGVKAAVQALRQQNVPE
jgi:hypothetical protein